MIAIASAADPFVASLVSHAKEVDQTTEDFVASLRGAPALLAYYMAAERGIEVDQPRTSSKAVLVELARQSA